MFLCFFDVVRNDAFVMGKLRLASISWTERVFCSSITDFISFVLTILFTLVNTAV